MKVTNRTQRDIWKFSQRGKVYLQHLLPDKTITVNLDIVTLDPHLYIHIIQLPILHNQHSFNHPSPKVFQVVIPMYPPMGAMGVNPYTYMISQPQQLPMHPQQAVQPGFTPQLMPGQFQQHNQYPRFQQGYQSVSPSPLMQHAIPAQYPPQQPYPNNSQFPQGYPTAPMYPGVPPYGYVPQQPNGGGFSGHPSPGRALLHKQWSIKACHQ